MAFLADETQGFTNFFSRAVPEQVVDLHPRCLDDKPGTTVRPSSPAAPHASVCVVELQQPAGNHATGAKEESSSSFFDGRSYFCARRGLPDDEQRLALDRLTGQPLTLYLVCVRAQGARSYYQAQAQVAESNPSTFRFALRSAPTPPPPNPATGYPALPQSTPGRFPPPPAGAHYPPPAGPYAYPPASTIPAVAHQQPHNPGSPYPAPHTLPVTAVPAYPYDSTPHDPPKQGCTCSLNWILFCFGFIFPPFWIVAMIRGSGMIRGSSRADNTAAAASFFALLFYIAVLVPVYWRYWR